MVGGVWHQRRSGRKLALTVEPLPELTAAQRRELDDEAALVGAVMEAAVTLTVGGHRRPARLKRDATTRAVTAS